MIKICQTLKEECINTQFYPNRMQMVPIGTDQVKQTSLSVYFYHVLSG